MDRPYDSAMNRVLGGAVPSTGSEDNLSNYSAQGSSFLGPVSLEDTIRDSFPNLWIKTFIRSTNWRPGAAGFSINGRDGEAEFSNVVIRGTLEGNSTIISGDAPLGRYIKIDGQSGSMYFHDSSGTLGATIVGDSAGVTITANGGDVNILGTLSIGGGSIIPALDLGPALGTGTLRFATSYFQTLAVNIFGTPGTFGYISGGGGSPEGAITGSVGSLWLRTDGGASTTLYIKESGSGNTGWVGK